MTRRLILLRHAKSSWAVEGMDDHERPLNRRGRESAAAIGRWLAEQGHLPELALSSDSARTRETWALLVEELPVQPQVHFKSELYLADPPALLAALQGAGAASTVLLLAHNPGIAETAMRVGTTRPERADFGRYPTCATAVFEVDIDNWASLAWRTAELSDFVVPREL